MVISRWYHSGRAWLLNEEPHSAREFRWLDSEWRRPTVVPFHVFSLQFVKMPSGWCAVLCLVYKDRERQEYVRKQDRYLGERFGLFGNSKGKRILLAIMGWWDIVKCVGIDRTGLADGLVATW